MLERLGDLGCRTFCNERGLARNKWISDRVKIPQGPIEVPQPRSTLLNLLAHLRYRPILNERSRRWYRLLNRSPVTWLGRISYSLYLWQELLCPNASLHLSYLLIVPSLAGACGSYYCVEQPMLRL